MFGADAAVQSKVACVAILDRHAALAMTRKLAPRSSSV